MSNVYSSNDEQNLVVIYSSNGTWVTIDTETTDVIGVSDHFTFSEDVHWNKTATDISAKKLAIYLELAESASTSLVVKEVSEDNFSFDKSFRVPKAVKSEGKFTADTATLREVYDYTQSKEFNLTPEPPLTLAWLDNIVDKHPLSPRAMTAAGFFPDPKAIYFGIPVDGDSPFILHGLLQYNTNTQEWLVRNPEHWDPYTEAGLPPYLVELDPDSAEQVALWIDRPKERTTDYIEFSDIYPEESALFFAAESELDMEFLDRVFDIYDSQERSVNARKQVRGAGGRFGGGGKTNADKQEAPTVKARLPYSLPLVENIGSEIDAYLARVSSDRLKGQEKTDDFAISAEASGAEVTDVTPMYLAIVDNIDPDAVLDVVALVPPKRGTQGDVSSWKRDNGQWVSAPEILQQLRGSTPPSVVKLEDETLLKNVLAQVDKSTAQSEETPEAPGATEIDADGNPIASAPAAPAKGAGIVASANPEGLAAIKAKTCLPNGTFRILNEADLKRAIKHLSEAECQITAKQHIKRRARALGLTDSIPADWCVWDIVRGFAYTDGSLVIHNVDDLLEAIYAAEDENQEAHVIKRARALNRLDLIPHGWDTYSVEDPDLWGPFGELVAAGGADRNRGNAERLRRYWTTGLGAAKIRWNTPGDWTRCVSHLSKYLGNRAKGYCQLRHKEVTGFYTGDKENLHD